LLFETGRGIGDLRTVVSDLTPVPVVVLNSHTHDDHVVNNGQFDTVYGTDTDFTRTNARGSREDARAEITPDQICSPLPKRFAPKTSIRRP
jgi:glyoxylase-like metal-dependent hydrolase (beta-lactamase superfamily II)